MAVTQRAALNPENVSEIWIFEIDMENIWFSFTLRISSAEQGIRYMKIIKLSFFFSDQIFTPPTVKSLKNVWNEKNS